MNPRGKDGPSRDGDPRANGFLETRVRLSEHAVYRTFALETVILNVKKGTYHGLNATAGRMLQALDRSATVAEAAEKVAAEYGRSLDEVEHDMLDLCRRLEERGLVERFADDGG